jgi:hypothetical protein
VQVEVAADHDNEQEDGPGAEEEGATLARATAGARSGNAAINQPPLGRTRRTRHVNHVLSKVEHRACEHIRNHKGYR